MEKVCFHIHYQTMDAEKRLLNAERDISTAGWPALRQLVSVLHVLRSCLAHQQTCIKKSSNEKLTDVTTLFSLSLPWREAGVEGETGGPQTPSDDSRSLSRMCIWWRCCKKVDVGEVSCLELQSAANPCLTCCSGPAAMDMRRLQAVNRAEPMSWRLGIVTPSMLWERLAWTERLASQMDETRQRVTPWAFCQVARKTVDTTDSKSYTVADLQRVLGIVL